MAGVLFCTNELCKKHCCAAPNHRSLLQVCHTKKKWFKRSAGKQPCMQTRGNRAIVEDLLLWSLKDASLATIVSVSVYEEPSSVPSETKGLPGSEGKKTRIWSPTVTVTRDTIKPSKSAYKRTIHPFLPVLTFLCFSLLHSQVDEL